MATHTTQTCSIIGTITAVLAPQHASRTAIAPHHQHPHPRLSCNSAYLTTASNKHAPPDGLSTTPVTPTPHTCAATRANTRHRKCRRMCRQTVTTQLQQHKQPHGRNTTSIEARRPSTLNTTLGNQTPQPRCITTDIMATQIAPHAPPHDHSSTRATPKLRVQAEGFAKHNIPNHEACSAGEHISTRAPAEPCPGAVVSLGTRHC